MGLYLGHNIQYSTKGDKMKDETSKHTPGPWGRMPAPVCATDHPHTWITADGDERLIAVVRAVVRAQAGETDANARLISAAPDLLAALRELREAAAETVAICGGIPEDEPMSRAFDALDTTERRAGAAIRKATGGGD